MSTESEDLVERLKSHATSWLRHDAFDGRDNEQEAIIIDEAAEEITRLRAALAAEKERCATFADERKEAALSRMRSAATEDARLLYDMEQATAGGIADAIRATE